jgi:WhiB family redox-sensing transcriptional regulator
LREKRAKEICAECPVQIECRNYALEIREQYGIWGGMTENERRLLAGW